MWTDHALAVDEETELKKYSVNPWEPVEANSPYAKKIPPDTDSDSYSGYDLGIYARYYPLYSAFVGSGSFEVMKANINNETGVCVNYEVRRNETRLGLFRCPMPFEPAELQSCCGENYAEFCCYDDSGRRRSQMYGALVLGGVLAFVIIQAVACWCLLGKRHSSVKSTVDG
ncbi:hypothetical protein NP493_870g02037 [Ridgeia piscesae]|uniref:Uncharacterized protein n=1 Tax=Ridgeia piscesae TaxID=27915 RepID=A0AAD9NM13_RIDPI|nr:hypothetical protein NP493_870g02037 [Ridgeia piscesae]